MAATAEVGNRVATRSAVQLILASAAVKQVIAVPAVQAVIAGVTQQGIVAALSEYRIGRRSPVQEVVVIGSINGRHPYPPGKI